MDVLIIKWIHILSSMFLFGTGMGTAFFKFTTDLSRNLQAMAIVNRRVVLADWLFTMPTVIVQPVSGFALAAQYGYPLDSPWLVASVLMYVIAGGCWLPVVYLQIRMRNDCDRALATGEPLPERYWRDLNKWCWLGVPAFIAMLATLYLMVCKPTFD